MSIADKLTAAGVEFTKKPALKGGSFGVTYTFPDKKNALKAEKATGLDVQGGKSKPYILHDNR